MSLAIDALIAEKCMGWRLVTDVAELSRLECRPVPDPKAAERHNRGVYFLGDERVGCLECGNIPEYSTDLTRAFDALAKMRERGWIVQFYARPGYEWWIALRFARHKDTVDVSDTSLPLAICRAILAALGVEAPQ